MRSSPYTRTVAQTWSEGQCLPFTMKKADKKAPYWAPLTFDLSLHQVQKIESVRRARGLRSASEVVRLAIAEFDLNAYAARRPRFRQISVRLASELREKLRRQARKKNVSIGVLLREAIESLPTNARRT
jgi:Arc/MetJ-type ribon-helix-helix transcriptional regulator